ncbi:MAG: hypothetical protein JWN02_2075 [Acidobacteria bacterium]|nr:hypothetical protein [Acidobacteriota bacterium]
MHLSFPMAGPSWSCSASRDCGGADLAGSRRGCEGYRSRGSPPTRGAPQAVECREGCGFGANECIKGGPKSGFRAKDSRDSASKSGFSAREGRDSGVRSGCSAGDDWDSASKSGVSGVICSRSAPRSAVAGVSCRGSAALTAVATVSSRDGGVRRGERAVRGPVPASRSQGPCCCCRDLHDARSSRRKIGPASAAVKGRREDFPPSSCALVWRDGDAYRGKCEVDPQLTRLRCSATPAGVDGKRGVTRVPVVACGRPTGYPLRRLRRRPSVRAFWMPIGSAHGTNRRRRRRRG